MDWALRPSDPELDLKRAHRKKFLGNMGLPEFAGVGSLTVYDLMIGLVTSVVLARTLGLDDFGSYSLYVSIAALLSIPVHMGLPSLVVREVASATRGKDAGQLKGVLLFGGGIVLLFSLLIALLVSVIVSSHFTELQQAPTVVTYLILMPALTGLLHLARSALAGSQKVLLSQLPNSFIRPTLFLILIGLYVLWRKDLLLADAIIASLCAMVAASVISVALSLYIIPGEAWNKAASIHFLQWCKTVLRLAGAHGARMALPHGLIVIVGFMLGEAAVGMFRIAQRGAGLLGLPSGVVTRSITPQISNFHSRGMLPELQQLMGKSFRILVSTTALGCFVFLIFGDLLVTVVFGQAYAGAAGPLKLLAFANFLSSLYGVGLSYLNMTGREQVVFNMQMLLLLVTVVTTIPLALVSGLTGVAVAVNVGALAGNLWMWLRFRKVGGIKVHAI